MFTISSHHRSNSDIPKLSNHTALKAQRRLMPITTRPMLKSLWSNDKKEVKPKSSLFLETPKAMPKELDRLGSQSTTLRSTPLMVDILRSKYDRNLNDEILLNVTKHDEILLKNKPKIMKKKRSISSLLSVNPKNSYLKLKK